MSLINCPECGKSISDQAKTCPNCGVAINRPLGDGSAKGCADAGCASITWVIMVAVFIMFIMFLFSC